MSGGWSQARRQRAIRTLSRGLTSLLFPLRRYAMRHHMGLLGASLLAGLIAIVVNTFILEAADWIPLVTARGGLLKLLKTYFSDPLARVGIADLWANLHLPGPDTGVFKSGFHIVVGLLMAVFYAFVLEPILPGVPLVKGLIYALLVWLANAFIVLPWIGEGIAGSRYLEFCRNALFRHGPHRLLRGARDPLSVFPQIASTLSGARLIGPLRSSLARTGNPSRPFADMRGPCAGTRWPARPRPNGGMLL